MKRLLKTVACALVGALLGYIIAEMFDPTSVKSFVWFFAGVPCGWIFLGRYFGHLVSTNLAMMLFFFTMRVLLAGLLGWVLMPIEVIRSLIEVFTGSEE